MVKVRCAWEGHLPPASTGCLLTTNLGEVVSFGLARLGELGEVDPLGSIKSQRSVFLHQVFSLLVCFRVFL